MWGEELQDKNAPMIVNGENVEACGQRIQKSRSDTSLVHTICDAVGLDCYEEQGDDGDWESVYLKSSMSCPHCVLLSITAEYLQKATVCN